MTRSSRKCRSRLVFGSTACLLAFGCAGRGANGPAFVTSSELPRAPRKPDGVVVDPSIAWPEPSDGASEEGTAIAALRPPLPEQAAREVVASFFRAVVGEDLDAMSQLMTEGAGPSARGRSGTLSVVDLWRSRLRHFHYRTLSGETLYQDADVELYRFDDLENVLPGRPFRPAEMGRTDVLVRVPMLVVRSGSDRVFGDEILFVLQRERARFRIRQLVEDFQPP